MVKGHYTLYTACRWYASRLTGCKDPRKAWREFETSVITGERYKWEHGQELRLYTILGMLAEVLEGKPTEYLEPYIKGTLYEGLSIEELKVEVMRLILENIREDVKTGSLRYKPGTKVEIEALCRRLGADIRL